MLVEGYKEMKPFLPAVEMKGQPVIFDDALDVAQNALVAEIIGTALESQLEQRQIADARLLKLCQRVISQQAFLSSIPDMDLILTDAGFGVVNNEQMTMASRERVQALSANLKLKLDDGKDALILYLLRTSTYEDWRGTEEFARLSDGLILTFAEFKDVAVLNNQTAAAHRDALSHRHPGQRTAESDNGYRQRDARQEQGAYPRCQCGAGECPEPIHQGCRDRYGR